MFYIVYSNSNQLYSDKYRKCMLCYTSKHKCWSHVKAKSAIYFCCDAHSTGSSAYLFLLFCVPSWRTVEICFLFTGTVLFLSLLQMQKSYFRKYLMSPSKQFHVFISWKLFFSVFLTVVENSTKINNLKVEIHSIRFCHSLLSSTKLAAVHLIY